MTDDNNDTLDTLIDDVARAMTTSTPGGPAGDDFARRVSMRIAEAGERRKSWFRPWVLVPLAAAIVLIVLVRLTPDTTRDANVDVRLKPDATNDATNDAARDAARDANVRLKPDATKDKTAIARIVPIVTGPPPAVDPIEIGALDLQPLVGMDEIQITVIAIDRIDIAAMP